jgi:membrane-bound lytic murein transglycosylase D
MKKNSFFFVAFLIIGLSCKETACFSQTTDETEILKDDPIAAALDSLTTLSLFEKGYAKINYPKFSRYNFAPDSVPIYDESVIAERLVQIDAASPFDLRYNSVVKGYIQLYALRRRELVARVMALSQLYFPLFEQQLDKYNLPLELKYLAICESALNPLARSHAGAMGLWQFMYPTGKMFGLKVTSYVDERCDPYKSTEAACQYFKHLYDIFGDWQMVLAAYNGGPGTVNKAIRRSGGKKTYWEIRPFLPKETQGYVPAFIAVNYIMNYTSEYNLYSAIPKKTFLQIDTITVKQQISFTQIAAVLDITEDELKYLNPTYRKGVIPASINEKNVLTLPSHKMGAFINNEEAIYNYYKDAMATNNEKLVPTQVTKIHTIRKGESLTSIAKKYNCSLTALKTWNDLKSNKAIPGKKLTIISNSEPIDKEISVPKKQAEKNLVIEAEKFKYYVIQKGDTLFKIAQKQQTTIEEIKRLNNFSTKYTLLPGKKIKVGVM